jgi:hypothetical protein
MQVGTNNQSSVVPDFPGVPCDADIANELEVRNAESDAGLCGQDRILLDL